MLESHRCAGLQHWLQHTGSPSSRIDKCVFSKETKLEEFSFSDFQNR